MNIDTQRRVDRFVGIPLCLLTGAAARLMSRATHRRREKPVRSICVIKFFGIGSIILSGPFLASLRALHPGARISYLTFASNAEAPALLPEVDSVLTISTGSWRTFAADSIRVLLNLRGCDIVFDLEFFSKFSTLLSTLSGAHRRSGFSLPTRWRSWNLTDSVPLDRTEHVSRMFLRQLLPFGLPSTAAPGPPAIAPPAGARETCFRKLGLRQDGTPILVVNANADETSLERRWRRERFAGVIDRVAAAFPGIQILLTGVSREREYVEGLRMLCHTPVRNTAGELSLAEFAVLLEASAAVLSNDSGTVHLAAAVGTPTVSLFGPESPEYYGPLDGSTALYAGVECSPCLNIYAAKRFVCPHAARCMESISVDETTGALLTVLGKEMAHAGVA